MTLEIVWAYTKIAKNNPCMTYWRVLKELEGWRPTRTWNEALRKGQLQCGVIQSMALNGANCRSKFHECNPKLME